jgi:hypothetical protein
MCRKILELFFGEARFYMPVAKWIGVALVGARVHG